MDYRKIAKIANDLEKCVLGSKEDEKSLPDAIDERTKKEQESANPPEPSLEAGKFDQEENISVATEDDQNKKASIKRLIRLARSVKASSLSESKKKLAMEKIANARKKLG